MKIEGTLSIFVGVKTPSFQKKKKIQQIGSRVSSRNTRIHLKNMMNASSKINHSILLSYKRVNLRNRSPGKSDRKLIVKRLIDYDAKENSRENFESYSPKRKNVYFQYIRCSPLASRRFKQSVYLLYQWRIYCNIFLDILHFLHIQEKRGNVCS